MTPTARPVTSLRGRRILVVEDEFLIADMLVCDLQDCGADVVGPAADIDDALDLIESDARFDAAILDLNLRGEMAFPVSDALSARGVPHVFTTGYGDDSIPERYRAVARIGKPVDIRAIATALFPERKAGA